MAFVANVTSKLPSALKNVPEQANDWSSEGNVGLFNMRWNCVVCERWERRGMRAKTWGKLSVVKTERSLPHYKCNYGLTRCLWALESQPIQHSFQNQIMNTLLTLSMFGTSSRQVTSSLRWGRFGASVGNLKIRFEISEASTWGLVSGGKCTSSIFRPVRHTLSGRRTNTVLHGLVVIYSWQYASTDIRCLGIDSSDAYD